MKFYPVVFLSILLQFFHNTNSLYLGTQVETGLLVAIDTTTYFQLSPEEKASLGFGLWPNLVNEETGAQCTYEIDALYTAHDQRYRVDDWVYIERDFQEHGGLAITMSIYDLQEFVSYLHRVGAWVEPDECQSIWHVIQNHGIVPILNQIGSQHRPTLTAREHGFSINFMCKFDELSSYKPCSSLDLYNLLEAHISPLMRVYKN